MKEFSDIEIIECLRKRESYVVHYLQEKYMPLIRLMVFQGGGSSEDASDIFQDGLIIILEKIDEGDFVLKCKFKTYLYCVCENIWLTVLDKRKAAANYVSNTSEEYMEKDVSDLMDKALYETIFRDVFEAMDITSRNILNMYWEDKAPQEIADKLGLTNGYVRKRKCEAQNELIQKIKEHPGYKRIIRSDEKANEIVR
ncbi:MAG TPA: sigma-70 family RNA polymerase sigma factor [Bacteroidales bacterium]|nr:sigma-70 family RNA polymerase sigma factor [Bacteroidales bacterium]